MVVERGNLLSHTVFDDDKRTPSRRQQKSVKLKLRMTVILLSVEGLQKKRENCEVREDEL